MEEHKTYFGGDSVSTKRVARFCQLLSAGGWGSYIGMYYKAAIPIKMKYEG